MPISLIFYFCLFIFSSITYACSCGDSARLLQTNYDNAQSIILAEIGECNKINDYNKGVYSECSYTLLDLLKGTAPLSVRTSLTTCGYNIKKNEIHLLFFTKHEPLGLCNGNGRYKKNSQNLTLKQRMKLQAKMNQIDLFEHYGNALIESKYKMLRDFKDGDIADLSPAWAFDDLGYKCTLALGNLSFSYIYEEELPSWINIESGSRKLTKGRFSFTILLPKKVQTLETDLELHLDSSVFLIPKFIHEFSFEGLKKMHKLSYYQASNLITAEVFKKLKQTSNIIYKAPIEQGASSKHQSESSFYIIKAHTKKLQPAFNKFEKCMAL